MSKLVLVSGGSRSGKSAFAQRLAEGWAGPRAFVATCPVIDPEMSERVRCHQLARSSSDWRTIEEPIDLAAAILGAHAEPVVLIDCLTLWVNNLLHAAGQKEETIAESEISRLLEPVVQAAHNHGGRIVFVTNEVGMGLVPETPLGRRFRDLAGRANQIVADESDEVFLVVCGQPLLIKPPSQKFPNT
ncbi:MAG: bifunctional adenosylcobinamide kinase/adenosylcobinamide-phosphate guanylyltransferase [Verrucomicrobiae bacterium]